MLQLGEVLGEVAGLHGLLQRDDLDALEFPFRSSDMLTPAPASPELICRTPGAGGRTCRAPAVTRAAPDAVSRGDVHDDAPPTVAGSTNSGTGSREAHTDRHGVTPSNVPANRTSRTTARPPRVRAGTSRRPTLDLPVGLVPARSRAQ